MVRVAICTSFRDDGGKSEYQVSGTNKPVYRSILVLCKALQILVYNLGLTFSLHFNMWYLLSWRIFLIFFLKVCWSEEGQRRRIQPAGDPGVHQEAVEEQLQGGSADVNSRILQKIQTLTFSRVLKSVHNMTYNNF